MHIKGASIFETDQGYGLVLLLKNAADLKTTYYSGLLLVFFKIIYRKIKKILMCTLKKSTVLKALGYNIDACFLYQIWTVLFVCLLHNFIIHCPHNSNFMLFEIFKH